MRQKILDWLQDYDISTSMVHVYTQDEWRARNEPYGNDAAYTITMEGELYTIMNHPTGPQDVLLSRAFVAFLARLGFHYEMGFAWSIHLYPEEPAPSPPPQRGDRPGWHSKAAQAANKASRIPLRPGEPMPPLLTPNAPRRDLEAWLAWADPDGRFIDWDDPSVHEEELWQALKALAADVQALENWSLGYNRDLSTFAAVRYPDVSGRTLLLVMTGEEGETPEPYDGYAQLALLELDEDEGDWKEVHAATFNSPAEAARAVETDPVWRIA